MEVILIDQTKFQSPGNSKDFNERAEKLMTDSLKKLNQKGVLSSAMYESMKPKGTNTLRLYGLPKVHKPGLPLRFVLNMYNSAFHGAAKWLVIEDSGNFAQRNRAT
ncbi:unnamed protein product [Trichobilharzia regenti]|nr:unnamed protein product [Trichobilharzia regenti]